MAYLDSLYKVRVFIPQECDHSVQTPDHLLNYMKTAPTRPAAITAPMLLTIRPAALFLEVVAAGAAVVALVGATVLVKVLCAVVNKLLGTVMLLVGDRTGMLTLPVPVAAAVGAGTKVVIW